MEEDLKQTVLEEDEDWRRLMAHGDSFGVDGYHGDIADAYLSRSSDDVVHQHPSRQFACGHCWQHGKRYVK